MTLQESLRRLAEVLEQDTEFGNIDIPRHKRWLRQQGTEELEYFLSQLIAGQQAYYLMTLRALGEDTPKELEICKLQTLIIGEILAERAGGGK